MMFSISPSSVHSWPPYIDQGKVSRLRRSLNTTLKANACALVWCSRVSPPSSSSASASLRANFRSNSPLTRLASAIAKIPFRPSRVTQILRPCFLAFLKESRHAVSLKRFFEPHAPVFADARLRQLHRREAFRSFLNSVPHIFLTIYINLHHLSAARERYIPLLAISRTPRLIAHCDELAVYRLALAAVAGIHVSGRKMSVFLRQELALFEADVPFFREALDGEDVAVIDLCSPARLICFRG